MCSHRIRKEGSLREYTRKAEDMNVILFLYLAPDWAAPPYFKPGKSLDVMWLTLYSVSGIGGHC